MISNEVVWSAKFIKMPWETQSLYFHLCMNADDDWVCEAFKVMRLTWASEDSIRLLQVKWFIRILNDDLVTYIMDRNEHNLLRADRKSNSIHKCLLLQVFPDIQLIEPKQRVDRKKNMGVLSETGTSHGQSMDGLVEYSIVESSIVESSIDISTSSENLETQTNYVWTTNNKLIDKDHNLTNTKKVTKQQKVSSKVFVPPTLEQVKEYFTLKDYKEEIAIKAFNYYEAWDRKDRNMDQINNRKQKMIGVWFKPENKIEKKKTNIIRDKDDVKQLYPEIENITDWVYDKYYLINALIECWCEIEKDRETIEWIINWFYEQVKKSNGSCSWSWLLAKATYMQNQLKWQNNDTQKILSIFSKILLSN